MVLGFATQEKRFQCLFLPIPPLALHRFSPPNMKKDRANKTEILSPPPPPPMGCLSTIYGTLPDEGSAKTHFRVAASCSNHIRGILPSHYPLVILVILFQLLITSYELRAKQGRCKLRAIYTYAVYINSDSNMHALIYLALYYDVFIIVYHLACVSDNQVSIMRTHTMHYICTLNVVSQKVQHMHFVLFLPIHCVV